MPNTDFQNGVILGSIAGGNIQTSAPIGDIEITENGEYDVTTYETATVNVAGDDKQIIGTKTKTMILSTSIITVIPTTINVTQGE